MVNNPCWKMKPFLACPYFAAKRPISQQFLPTNILSRFFFATLPFWKKSNCWSQDFDQRDAIPYSKIPWTSVPFSEDARPCKTWGNSYWPAVPILPRVSHCQPSSEFAVLGNLWVCTIMACFCMRRKLLFDTWGKNLDVPVSKMAFAWLTTCHPLQTWPWQR